MKTRIIQTRFWDDEFITDSSKDTKYLYLYLLTSQYVNISGMFQLSEKKIQFETGLTPKEFESSRNDLEEGGKAFFFEGWVFLPNARKNNNYESSPKNVTAYQKEIDRVPEKVKKHFDTIIHSNTHTTIDSTMDSSMHSTHKSKSKSKIINHKSKTQNTKLTEIVQFYNEVFEKNVKSTKGFEKNFEIWEKTHDIEKMKIALSNAKTDKFWRDKMTLTILFRTRNPQGEDVDYIEDLANRDRRSQGNIAVI